MGWDDRGRAAVVGAGMAGLACAARLTAAGMSVVLFDKGRGPGGRMSTRHVDADGHRLSFDHGAQYFTVRNPGFAQQVAAWEAAGIARHWPEAGRDAWVGVPGMNAPIRHETAKHDVRFGQHVDGLMRRDGQWFLRVGGEIEGPFETVIVAVPGEQAAALIGLHDLAMARHAMVARSQPCWTAMISFGERIAIDEDHLRDADPIGWAARNNAKPGRAPDECWVVQATGSWSATHLEDEAADVAATLLASLADHAKAPLPPVTHLAAHRWRFAMTRGADQTCLWNESLRLGACGDWLTGPRVECAWLSGDALGREIVGAHTAAVAAG